MTKRLHKGDEAHRRWKIIDASRAADASLVPQLLARLDGDESYDNRRHIVRALGNIGGPLAEDKLIGLLCSEQGLILGDIDGRPIVQWSRLEAGHTDNLDTTPR